MNKYLLVPVHLDALYLKNGTSVAEAMVEFNRLPYFSGERDVNPDIVNLSESIVSQPFQNKNLYLKPGIHLHWALPDALTKESKNGGFPYVPNRWLISRKKGEETTYWIVESDYLYPLNEGFQEDSITYPYKDQSQANSPPFRYLGRKLTLDEWLNNASNNSQYLERLTAIGYGEPTFAAFYPNCRSVFGFHDSEHFEAKQPIQYDVIGWYSNSKQDYLNEFFTNFKANFAKEKLTTENFINAIQEEFKWTFGSQDNLLDSQLFQIICYSRLIFNKTSKSSEIIKEKVDIALAVANTGTEALSAYLAETLDKSQKKNIEEQLEALQFAESLESQILDTGAKFQELRHEADFDGVSGGFLWKINIETKQSNSDHQSSQTKLNLPSDIASLLTEVNQKQQEYDCELVKINSRRRQLFSDWYKYMVSTYPPEDSWDNYPDIDAVKYYIQIQGLEPLQSKLNEIGKLIINCNQEGKILSASACHAQSASCTGELAKKVNQLINSITIYNKKLDKYNTLNDEKKKETPPIYYIERVNSPRYWQPKEPVVLMVGDDIKASQRHGEDGLLECHLLEIGTIIQNFKTIRDFTPILEKIEELKPQDNQEKIGFSIWNEQPWNPFLLEWLVELFPVYNGGNKTSSNRNYSDDFLTQNYTLETNDVDISPKPNQSLVPDTKENSIKTDSDSNIYSGFSILTNYANSLLQERIKEYLKKYDPGNSHTEEIINPVYQKIFEYETYLQQKKERNQEIENYLCKSISKKYYQDQEVIKIDSDLYLGKIENILENIQSVKTWYESNSLDFIPHPIYTAKQAQIELEKLNCLSQSLGGFNEALLMHKQTLQLGINDPIGFADYQTFTNEVAKAVENEIKSAPQPLDDFSPIRSGEMRIIDLQLIDTFGQVRNLEWNEYVIKPESMKAKDNNRIVLPPRFVQPCRINFRWLSANNQNNNNQKTNDHPNTNPICGWILPNNLNNSLMIYDSKGQALGSINVNGEWDNAPGSQDDQISNLHLKKLINKLIDLAKQAKQAKQGNERNEGNEFFKNFNLCLNNALNNIDPENFAQHESLALLIGRPIAVVRASVNLELLGLPAINQDWNIFRQEMDNNTPLEARDTDNFVNVKFPIRIGEYKQLNDGVIGYWKETQNGGYEGNIFYAQQSDSNESNYIETQYWDKSNNPEGVEEGAINIIQSINSLPQILTMLVDPRCQFHATSGILPSKSITIPPEHYQEALANIKVTFLTAPILTDMKQLHLPLLSEPAYNWSWLEKKGEYWSEISTIPFIEKETFRKYLKEKNPEANSQEYWQNLFTQNWLKQSNEKGFILSKDNRPQLKGILQGQDANIEEIFDLGKIVIDPVNTQAKFSSQQEIREGWLILMKESS